MNESNAVREILEDSADLNNYCNSERVTKRKPALQLYSLPFDYKVSSDEVLVRLFVNNRDEKAFNEIVKRYSYMILGFAMKLCRNNHDAEDIKQDVLLILATKLHTFKGNSKFSTWLYRVTLNTCYKYLNDSNKRANKEIDLDESFLSQPPTEHQWSKRPDEIALFQERINIIGKAVNELTQSNKEIFNLKDLKGFSNAEVGEHTGLSISAVKSRVLRTRLILKEKISEHFRTT
jgi:RNA polymerase sigma-70 factor (ECF subfamily)